MNSKLKSFIHILLSGILLSGSAFGFVGCNSTDNPSGEKPNPDDPTQGETPGTNPNPEDPGDNPGTTPEPENPGDNPGTTPEPENPPLPPPDPPKLASITLDDGSQLEFDAEITEYTLTLPAGRPRVPRISATAEDNDAKVTVYQAMFGENVTETYARIEVSLNGVKQSYKVNFKKDASLGFALQYDDRYVFTPDVQTEGAITYQSSDTTIATVSSDGTIVAKACTESPVTITAYVNGERADALTIDRIDKAQLNIFIVAGQSNAAGTYDDDYATEKAKGVKPKKGIARCVDVSSSGSMSSPYDLNAGREGFAASLVTEWYKLTGEKSLVIQSAVGGAPIETWQKDGDKFLGGNLYNNTLKAYNKYRTQYDAEDSTYEIIRVGYFWCQGETAQTLEWTGSAWKDPGTYIMPADDYYTIFTENHNNFVADMDVDFASIALVRCVKKAASAQNNLSQALSDLVAPRAAQYALHNTGKGSIFIASRLGDVARPLSAPDKTAVGYGYMGSANLHYSQTGYNAQGIELATNTYSMFSATVDRSPTELEVIASNGKTRINDGDTITVDREDGYQIASMVLPMYTDMPGLTYKVVSGSAKCSIDKYGFISFASSAADGESAVICVESESGIKKLFTVVLGQYDRDEINGNRINYTWNFDNFKEANGLSNLSLSENSPKGQYVFNEGVLIKKDRQTDFVLASPFFIASNFDWSIEWRGLASAASCLFGANGSNLNFIYLAFNVADFDNSFRMVTSDGTAVQIPYGKYIDHNYTMNTWRLEYTQSTKTMTLYYINQSGTAEVVGSHVWKKSFLVHITNMFGRYGDTSVNVCYKGKIDYIKVDAMALN